MLLFFHNITFTTSLLSPLKLRKMVLGNNGNNQVEERIEKIIIVMEKP